MAQTSKHLGSGINVQRWRQLVCKIAEKCLPHGSMIETLLGVPGATWKTVAHDNYDAVDLQTGHSTMTRILNYAVEFDAGRSSRSSWR